MTKCAILLCGYHAEDHYNKLMKFLEKLGFKWKMGQKPTGYPYMDMFVHRNARRPMWITLNFETKRITYSERSAHVSEWNIFFDNVELFLNDGRLKNV